MKKECDRLNQFFKSQGIKPKTIMDKIAALMLENAGVARTETGLMNALSAIESMKVNDLQILKAPRGRRFNLGWIEAIQVPYMLDVAEMIVRAALLRTESRGTHFREDFTETRSDWLKHTRILKNGEAMDLGSVPVIITKLNPEVTK